MLSGHPEQIGPLPIAGRRAVGLWSGFATNTAFTGPWGVSYAANLTPDQNTGLGIWTEDMFIKTIRTGRHMGVSRPINPPMPWPAYRNATDEDLKAGVRVPAHHQADREPRAGVSAACRVELAGPRRAS